MTWTSGEKLVRIYSRRPVDQRKLKKAGVKPSNGTKIQGYFYSLPLARLKWGVRGLGPRRVLPKNHPFVSRNLPYLSRKLTKEGQS